MSVQKAKDSGSNSTANLSPSSTLPTLQPTEAKRWQGEMTREQALAVSWTGLQALAMNGQLIICNDKKTGRVWFGIANAKAIRSQTGNVVRLIDTANAAQALAESETK